LLAVFLYIILYIIFKAQFPLARKFGNVTQRKTLRKKVRNATQSALRRAATIRNQIETIASFPQVRKRVDQSQKPSTEKSQKTSRPTETCLHLVNNAASR